MFLLCKYEKGQGNKNPILHKCELISNEEYSASHNKSVSKFLEDYINEYNIENAQKQRDQANKDNFRVMCFRIKLSSMLLSSISFYNIYNWFSNVCSIQSYIRDYIESYGYDM